MKNYNQLTLLFVITLLFSNMGWAQSGSTKQEDSKELKEAKDQAGKVTTEQLIQKIAQDLSSKNKLTGINLVEALKVALKSSELTENAAKAFDKRFEEITKKIEALEKTSRLTDDQLIRGTVDIFTGAGGMCIKEKEPCEEKVGCCEGLKCIPIYKNPAVKKAAYVCVKPIKLGKSCVPFQSICETGSCLDFYTNSTVLPICTPFGKSCSKDAECCSTICDDNKCNTSYRCQNCVPAGKKIDASKKEKCCEGLYDNLDGMCVSDYPPQASIAPSKKKINLFFKFFDGFLNLIIPGVEAAEQVGQNSNPAPVTDENSDFKTCTFNSKRNYLKQLQLTINSKEPYPSYLNDSIDAIRAFEFMGLGPGVEDFWKDSSGKTIHARAKELAEKIKAARLDTEGKFQKMDEFMTCTCIDIKGINDSTVTETQRAFFKASCVASAVSINTVLTQNNVNAPTVALEGVTEQGVTLLDDQGVGASGIKYKEMLVRYFAKRLEIQSQLVTANVAPSQGFMDIANFIDTRQWDAYNKGPHVWYPGGQYKDIIDEVTDFLKALANTLIDAALGAIEYAVSSLAGSPQTTYWSKIPGLWKNGFMPADCYESSHVNHYTGCDVACVRYATTHYFTCTEEVYTPNNVCGMLMPDSFCVKTAIKRTDHGTGGENRFLIDPLLPAGFTVPHQLNIMNGMNWNTGVFPSFNAYSFNDTHYEDLKALAALYAKDQGFYTSVEGQNKFGDYVVNQHLIKPYLSNAGEVKYPTPGIVSYYEDMYNKMEFLSEMINYTVNPPNDDPANPPCGDICTFIKYATDYTKTVEGLGGGKKITPGSTLYPKILDMKGAINMANLQLGSVGSSTPPSGSDYDKYKNSLLSGATMSGFGTTGSAAINKAKKKKIFDDWMKKVGSTPKGKALLQAKSMSGIYGLPQGGSGGSGGSSTGNNLGNNSNPSNDSSLSNTSNASAAKMSTSGELDESDNYGSQASNRRRGSGQSQNEDKTDNSKEALEEIKGKSYQPINEDTLFQIVSKAYARGAFPNLLYGQPGIPLNKAPSSEVKNLVDDEKVFAPTKSKKRKAPN